MILNNFLKNQFKNFKNRVHNNINGQVAIFVALIFQIVFILFALMINVGLLIHHKINLQQSTDLAAYYGAMKQAEMLNVVSHVNFQIRQSFKLMTWRYRILGTFGMEKDTGIPMSLAIEKIGANAAATYKYNPAAEISKCAIGSDQLGLQDIPFMCLAHYGFKEYPNGVGNTETFCKLNCSKLDQIPLVLPDLPVLSSGATNGWGSGITDSINSALINANTKIRDSCNATGPISIVQLVKFYVNYLQDTKNKMLFIKMLLANLSAEEKSMLDIEGNSILKGAENTFRNNLTEANNTSNKNDSENIFETYNSISNTNSSDCAYTGISESNTDSGNAKLFAEINFKFIQYFILKCEVAGGASNISAGSVYQPGDPTKLNTILKTQINDIFGSATADRIEQIFGKNFFDHTAGIEKNPWCPVYYGVKSTSTPIIPFLPISKIKLHATAFAKPFGGSVGPRAYKDWAKTESSSKKGADQTDKNLPIQNPVPSDFTKLRDAKKILLNYSNYVGDTLGLADTKFIAVYHDMLKNRSVANETETASSNSKQKEPVMTVLTKPINWPAYAEWDGLSQDIFANNCENPKYDALAYDTTNDKNSYMRDIELSVVAPNQFETTYYSIEPDFYNVYVYNKLDRGLQKLKEQAGLSGTKLCIPKDFGHNNNISGIAKNFSVRNQIEIVQHIMRGNQNKPPASVTYSFGGGTHSQNMTDLSSYYFSYIPFQQGSLLTSWTMKDLFSDNFAVVTQESTKMPFAKCDDEELLGNGYGAIAGSANPSGGSDPLPPAPGNCITGGRSGYSVKIISSSALFSDQFTVGNATDSILNPPTGFISF